MCTSRQFWIVQCSLRFPFETDYSPNTTIVVAENVFGEGKKSYIQYGSRRKSSDEENGSEEDSGSDENDLCTFSPETENTDEEKREKLAEGCYLNHTDEEKREKWAEGCYLNHADEEKREELAEGCYLNHADEEKREELAEGCYLNHDAELYNEVREEIHIEKKRPELEEDVEYLLSILEDDSEEDSAEDSRNEVEPNPEILLQDMFKQNICNDNNPPASADKGLAECSAANTHQGVNGVIDLTSEMPEEIPNYEIIELDSDSDEHTMTEMTTIVEEVVTVKRGINTETEVDDSKMDQHCQYHEQTAARVEEVVTVKRGINTETEVDDSKMDQHCQYHEQTAARVEEVVTVKRGINTETEVDDSKMDQHCQYHEQTAARVEEVVTVKRGINTETEVDDSKMDQHCQYHEQTAARIEAELEEIRDESAPSSNYAENQIVSVNELGTRKLVREEVKNELDKRDADNKITLKIIQQNLEIISKQMAMKIVSVKKRKRSHKHGKRKRKKKSKNTPRIKNHSRSRSNSSERSRPIHTHHKRSRSSSSDSRRHSHKYAKKQYLCHHRSRSRSHQGRHRSRSRSSRGSLRSCSSSHLSFHRSRSRSLNKEKFTSRNSETSPGSPKPTVRPDRSPIYPKPTVHPDKSSVSPSRSPIPYKYYSPQTKYQRTNVQHDKAVEYYRHNLPSSSGVKKRTYSSSSSTSSSSSSSLPYQYSKRRRQRRSSSSSSSWSPERTQHRDISPKPLIDDFSRDLILKSDPIPSSLSSSTYVTQRTYHQHVRQGSDVYTRKSIVTTSFKRELKSFSNSARNYRKVSKSSYSSDSDNPLDRIPLRVYDNKENDVTKNQPSGDLNHPFYIHPQDAELYRIRMKNGMFPVMGLHEICMKCRWSLPTYFILPTINSEQGFRFSLSINDHRFITSRTGQQKKLAKAELAKAVLQWFKILDS
ncbi:serine-rich adhesin for platelets-like isoform X5 [Homalodisca vitripennis]|uniref:serine-rich adhesin for platelets-like isoform X5 n=1 Tax=Homalodisca vitripennis TaxID=197043 RepID=UPI001EECCF3F|nr:serine-rich adhesin for platelets-like isoform X5 [Homalodisca vitripennis]